MSLIQISFIWGQKSYKYWHILMKKIYEELITKLETHGCDSPWYAGLHAREQNEGTE